MRMEWAIRDGRRALVYCLWLMARWKAQQARVWNIPVVWYAALSAPCLRLLSVTRRRRRPRGWCGEASLVERGRGGEHVRFLAIALLPRETADIPSAVARLLEPYDRTTPAPPYKRYVSEQTLRSHAARWGIAMQDLPALARSIHERSAPPRVLHLQADAIGVYAMVETNPNGTYQHRSLNSLADDVWPVAAMPRDLAPYAIITSDGHWHALFPTFWGRIPSELENRRIMRKAHTLIDQYPNLLAARLECHI